MKFAVSTLHFSQPVAIRHGSLGIQKAYRDSILEHFIKFKEQNETYGQPGQGWRTHNQIHQDEEILTPLLDAIHVWYVNNITGPRGPKMISDWQWQNTNNLEIDCEVWFQELLPGQGCPKHEHGTLSRYSWVYYLNVDDGATPLVFTKLQEQKNELSEVDTTLLSVYNDLLVMFPSTLLHHVEPAESNRYIIAGNINDVVYKEPQ
tara:strand:- start:776 stop:1390 length:615 start_codon:yes stop_codon:yes gene_type:complete